MKKKSEPTYSLTPKGFFGIHVGTDNVNSFLDDLELFLRRGNYNAIIFDEEKGFIFSKVYLEN